MYINTFTSEFLPALPRTLFNPRPTLAVFFFEVSAHPDDIARPDGCIRARPGRVARPDVVFVEMVAELVTK